jgi:uncharacterized protein (TIGR03083 family)
VQLVYLPGSLVLKQGREARKISCLMEPFLLIEELKELDELLVDYLRDLTPEQWNAQTVARKWRVKDVALHLLDGNLRAISMLRDGYWSEPNTEFNSYEELLAYLNGLNASWIEGTRRLSPQVTMDLLAFSGVQYLAMLAELDPFAEATFSVAWAGEEVSQNWFHIAREYTEKWHHQQQIRLATGDEDTLLAEKYYRPFLATAVHALPHHYRDVPGSDGEVLQFIFRGETDKSWSLLRENKRWLLTDEVSDHPRSLLIIPDRFAWQVLMKAMTREKAAAHVRVEGDKEAALHLLNLIAVMA